MSSVRVLIRNNGLLYYLLSFTIDKNDGSVYISLVNRQLSSRVVTYDNHEKNVKYKDIQPPERNTKNISYHSSGMIKFHNAVHKTVFCEPISKITKINSFLRYLIPGITNKLDLFEEPIEKDFIWDLSEDRPYCFSMALCPHDFFSDSHHVVFRYGKMFSLIIEECVTEPLIPSELSQGLVTIAPTEGLFTSQKLPEDQALIDFKQRIYNTLELILEGPNGEGVYEIIACRPMHTPPKLNVIFADSDLYFEQITNENIRRNKAVVKFKVKHNKKAGYVKSPVTILEITLDSRLGA